MAEEWRKVPGLLMEVTRTGKVRAVVKHCLRATCTRWRVRRIKPTVSGNTSTPRVTVYCDGAFFPTKVNYRCRHSIGVARAMSLAFEGPISSDHRVKRCGSALNLASCCRFDKRHIVPPFRKGYGQSIVDIVLDARAQNPPISYGVLSKRLNISTSKLHKIVNGNAYAPERAEWAKRRDASLRV